MIKQTLIVVMMLLTSGCSYLLTHPQVEADLKKEAVDIAKDTEQVVEDIIQAAPNTTIPISPTVTP